MLIPSTNTTVEIEYTRLLPTELQAHYARLGKEVDTPFSPGRVDDIAYQSKMLGNARVEAIALTQTLVARAAERATGTPATPCTRRP